jgi:hypothetical protein
MNVREAPAQPAPPTAREAYPGREDPYPAIKARGSEIILTTPTRRVIFFTRLAGAVILVLLVTLLALT